MKNNNQLRITSAGIIRFRLKGRWIYSHPLSRFFTSSPIFK
jgi:hypothetical protein